MKILTLCVLLFSVYSSQACQVFGTSGVQNGTFNGVTLYSPSSNALGTVTASGAVYSYSRGYLGYRSGNIIYKVNSGQTGMISGSSVLTWTQAVVGRGIGCNQNELAAAGLLLWL